MTQALSISMLMLGADITLTSDTKAAKGLTADNQLPQTDDGNAEQGSGFSTLLQGMVQPANNGKAGFDQRQIPAAASALSAISAAMLQATTSDADSANSDDPALANSLLVQIALQNQAGEKADTDSEIATAEGDATVEAALAQTELEAEPDADSGLAAKQRDALTLPAAGSQVNTATDNEQVSDTAVVDDAATDSPDGGLTKLVANDKVMAATPGGAQAADSNAAGAPSDANTAAGQRQTSLSEGVAAQDSTEPAEAELLVQQQNQQAAATVRGAATAGADSAKTAPVKSRAASANADKITPTEAAADVAHQAKAALTAESAAALNSQAKATTDGKADDKPLLSNSDSEKLSSKAEQANINKSTVAEQGTQQQQQGQGQSDRQFSALASQNSSTKPATEAARVENSFASSLHSAESRQQTQTSKVMAKTASEQLKQSLNLQQHDAAGQLRERVSIMLRQNIQIAEIRLDPAGLGQMQIKIDMQQEQTNVQFVVQQPQAKELLEQQLPRLRELLQQQGIVLGEGSVQQQSQQERQLSERQQQNGRGQKQGTAEDGLGEDSIQTQLKVAPTDRLVDYYA